MLTEIGRGRPKKKERQKRSSFVFTPPSKNPRMEKRTPLHHALHAASDPIFVHVPQASTGNIMNMSVVSEAAFTERASVELEITGVYNPLELMYMT